MIIFKSWVVTIVSLPIFGKILESNIRGPEIENGTIPVRNSENLNATKIEDDLETPLTTTEITTITTKITTTFTLASESEQTCKCGVLDGIFPTGKIVGGTPVHRGRNQFWPWVATLVHESRPTIAHCGASLISPQYLLSAGHCVLPMIQYGLKNFRVKLGYNDLLRNNGGGMDVSIESAYLHPEFLQANPYHFDIGLLKLSHSVQCGKQIRPVCLPRNSSSSFLSTAITTGFGKTKIDGHYSSTLLQIELRLISTEECRQRLSKLWYKVPSILENMQCAWAKGKDSCVGDSGNPLFYEITENEENGNPENLKRSFEQIGLTSWGIGCANNDNYPGVYTKVQDFLPWIRSVALDLED